MRRNKTTAEFIVEARRIHGDLYDYSRSVYLKARTKLEIGCKQCERWFFQTPDSHLRKKGCPNCFGRKKKTTEEFISQARSVHGDLYGYGNVDYRKDSVHVEIECKKCGTLFMQRPNHHLKGHGCKTCASSKPGSKKKKRVDAYKRLTTAEFVAKSEYRHGTETFDHSRVSFDAMHKEVEIGCKKCGGWFFRTPANHLNPHTQNRCPLCISNERALKFYADAELRQGKGRYLFGGYANCRSDVDVTCNYCGIEFRKQASRLTSKKISCPGCGRNERMSSRGKNFIRRAQLKHGPDLYNYTQVVFDGADKKVDIICNECDLSFRQTPYHHLEGSGCPRCSASGFDPQKPAILYYVRFNPSTPDSTPLYKIGITNRTVQERFSSEPLPYTILDETPYLFGFLARDREQQILRDHQADRYQGDALVSGNTEAFVCDILGLDKAIAA